MQVIMISHNLELIEPQDNIIEMVNGEIIVSNATIAKNSD